MWQVIKPFHTRVMAGALLGLLGCSTIQSGNQKYRVSDAGYASVKTAPAVAREMQSEADNPKQRNWQIEIRRITQQNNKEAEALQTLLQKEESENFVELRFIWEPESHYLFSFLKDADVTLAKYTSNPLFKANIVKHTAEALEAKSREYHDALSALYPENNLENGSSVDILKGKLVADLSLYEEDFDSFPTLDRFRDDPMVELRYNGPLDPPEVLSAEAAPLIRYLAHGKIREPIVIVGYSGNGKIRLKDGCFFLDDGKRKDQLVVFPRRVGAVIDDDGYIALIDRSPHPGGRRPTRVGEPARWYSGPEPVTDLDVLRPLQAACGQYDAVIIGAPFPDAGA